MSYFIGETWVISTPSLCQWLVTSVGYWTYAGMRSVTREPPQLWLLLVIVGGCNPHRQPAVGCGELLRLTALFTKRVITGTP